MAQPGPKADAQYILWHYYYDIYYGRPPKGGKGEGKVVEIGETYFVKQKWHY